jgi:hypothetical protein
MPGIAHGLVADRLDAGLAGGVGEALAVGIVGEVGPKAPMLASGGRVRSQARSVAYWTAKAVYDEALAGHGVPGDSA